MKLHHVAHPYDCSKYIDCSGPGDTFVKEDYVWHYEEGLVYNPANGLSAELGDVGCAALVGKLKLTLFHIG